MKKQIAAILLLAACAGLPAAHSAAKLSDDTIWTNYTKSGASAQQDDDLEQAEALYAAALDVAERTGKQDSRLVTSLHQLAHVMKMEGKFAKAEPLYRQELALQGKLSNTKLSDTEATISALASVSNSQKKYQQARDYYNQLLALIEKSEGAKSDSMLKPLHKLVLVENSMGDHANAEADCQKQIAIIEQSQELAGSTAGIEDLAVVYRQENRFDKAAAQYEQALASLKEKLGDDDLSLVPLLDSLAFCYEKTGDNASAEKAFLEAMKIDKHDKDKLDEVPVLANYIQLLKTQGRSEEAEKLEHASEKFQAEDTKPVLP